MTFKPWERTPAPVRLWPRLIHDEAGCWLWPGGLTKGGYGVISYQGRTINTHRLAWVLTNGPIPLGLLVLHHCDVRRCCNPAHLFIGTQLDNIRDMDAKGRRVVAGAALREDVR